MSLDLLMRGRGHYTTILYKFKTSKQFPYHFITCIDTPDETEYHDYNGWYMIMDILP